MNVLAVDDQKLNLKFIEHYIKDIDPLVNVILCQDPSKAYGMVEEHSVDAIVLDILMTPVTGIDLLKMFRKDERLADVPILMFSSITDSETIRRCFDWGANDYLSKPIDEKEFNARVKAVINSRKAFLSIREKNDATAETVISAKAVYEKVKDVFDMYERLLEGYERGTLSLEEAGEVKREIARMRSSLSGVDGAAVARPQ